MAAPSLGQAIGLRVERKDIFAPAAKMLSENLAAFAEKKERRQKAKEESASKFMSEMFKLSPDGLNRKVRPEAVKFYNGKMTELETLLDNPEINQIELLKKIDETRAGLASFRDQSTSFDSVDKLILSDPNKVPTPLRNFMSNKDLIPDTNTQTLFSAYNIDYDPDSNMIRSVGSGKMDVREELIKNKASADALLANMTPEERNKSMVKVKTMTGYDPKAFIVLKPDQQSYLLNLSNVMSNNPSALNTISDEIIEGMYGGDINKYSEAVTKIIEDQYQKDLAAASATPGAAQAVPKMLAKDAMNLMATEYMLKNNFPEYVQRTTSLEDLNKTAQSGAGGGDKVKPANLSAASTEYQFTPEGYKKAKEEGKKFGKTPEQIIDIYTGADTTTPENISNQIRSVIDKQGLIVNAPTMSVSTQGAEKINLAGTNYNVRKLWYDTNNKKFYAIVDKQVSGESTSVNINQETILLTPPMMKDLTAAMVKDTSIKEQLLNWNKIASEQGWLTTDQYQAGGSSARPASGRASRPSGKGMTLDELNKKGLNIKDYKLSNGLWYKK